MANKKLTLKNFEFQQLNIELDIFTTNPEVDMLIRHYIKKIKGIIKPTIEGLQETRNELIKKYADVEGGETISPTIKETITKEDGTTEEVDKPNEKMDLFIKELEEVNKIEETVSIVPIPASKLEKYNLNSYQEVFQEAFKQFGILGFTLIYEIFE